MIQSNQSPSLHPKHFSIISSQPNYLLVGGYDSAIDIPTLQSLNITTVITAARNMDLDYSPYPSIKRHKVYPIVDDAGCDIMRYFKESFCLIDKALTEGGVLVHCAAGVSRSATLVIAYLMRKHRWKFASALKYMQSRRKVVKPNPGFELQLIRYEHYLHSLKLLESIQSQTQKQSGKSLVSSRMKRSENQKTIKRFVSKSRTQNNISLASTNFKISKPKPFKS